MENVQYTENELGIALRPVQRSTLVGVIIVVKKIIKDVPSVQICVCSVGIAATATESLPHKV